MQAIKEWLNGPKDYDAGVDLFLKHSKDRKLHQVFLEGKTTYKCNRLLEEMKKLLTQQQTVTRIHATTKQNMVDILQNETKVVTNRLESVNSAKGTGKFEVTTKGWGHPDQMDPVIKSLFLQWKPLFKEMETLQSRIDDVAKPGTPQAVEEAGRMAHRILDLDQLCDDIYQKRDHYKQAGSLPNGVNQDDMDDVVTDPKMWPTALQTAKRMARKYRTKLENNPKDANAAALQAKWDKRVNYYSEKINGL